MSDSSESTTRSLASTESVVSLNWSIDAISARSPTMADAAAEDRRSDAAPFAATRPGAATPPAAAAAVVMSSTPFPEVVLKVTRIAVRLPPCS